MTIDINLPKKAEAMLFDFAKEQKISKKDFIKNAILEYLEDLSDLKEAHEGRISRINGEKGESWDSIKN